MRENRHDIETRLMLGQAGSNTASPVPLRAPRSLVKDAARAFARNRLALVGVFLMALVFAMALGADNWFVTLPFGREPKPLIARTPYDKIFFGPSGAFPSLKYWMGTDLNGRDQFSRIVFGARVSLTVAILSQIIAVGIGVPLGALAGWRGGWVDYLVMRAVDVMSAFPTLLFAFLIMARLGAGFWNVMFAIGITSWIGVCRLTRAQFLSLRKKEYVEAAVVAGASSRRIVSRHLLPNAYAPLIVALTLGIPAAIFAEASLSFLGVGINPPMPSWGQMLGRDGVANIGYYWHLALFPAVMVAFTMLGFTLVGDGLRDAFDPRTIGQK